MARVLVVEDDEPIRALVARILERDGHTVVGARHGGEAIDYLSGRTIDEMVLDVMMPIANGGDVLTFMREARKWTPTILLTAVHERQIAILNTEGVHAIVKKPFDISLLRESITSCVMARPIPEPDLQARVDAAT